jgi:hypothetical protein
MKRCTLVAVLVIAAVYVAPAGAAPNGSYICTGNIGGDPISGLTPQVINGNLDVPAGATCSMFASEVTGNVTVEGALVGYGNTFDRNVKVSGGTVGFGNPFFSHGLGESQVGGNLDVSTSGSVELSVQVAKNLRLTGASAADLSFAGVAGNVLVTDSTNVVFFDSGGPEAPGIGGNLTLIGNHGVTIGFTAVGGNLNCEANDPAPVEEPQVSARSATGQCTLTP